MTKAALEGHSGRGSRDESKQEGVRQRAWDLGGPWQHTVQGIVRARRESLQGRQEGTVMQDDMIRDQKVASSLLIWTHVGSSEHPSRSSAADEIRPAGPTRGKKCVCRSWLCHFLWLLGQMHRLTPHVGCLYVGTLRTEGQLMLYMPSHAECLPLIGTDMPLSLAIALRLTPGKSCLFSEPG